MLIYFSLERGTIFDELYFEQSEKKANLERLAFTQQQLLLKIKAV
jgi:hypothetical protein